MVPDDVPVTRDLRAVDASDTRTQGMPRLPIGIVADVRLYREGLAACLSRCGELVIAWTAADVASAVAKATEGSALVAVIDLSMHDSLYLARAVRRAAPSLAIVAFASHEGDREIIACVEAGMGGLVACDGTVEELALAVKRAARGEMSCSPRAAAVMTRRLVSLADAHAAVADVRNALTARESSILDLLDRGLSNKEIAARLNIQVATVKNHVHNVLEKLRVTSRAEAAAKRRASCAPRSLLGLSETTESSPPPTRI